ncbi:S-layer homology domain-containing protein [Bacillus bingmayongensis]|uniref:S-layer homology domain-containing protein n=1 Tax=Bacillus bingmayongensis TaxID=1150157 RepID=UPI001C8D4AC1|nr:S-layer homology domain-containing protein [Bacillus bingmayongensis]MBY0600318.1 S-layer homology domain-containing protein [Bacillus bingmayongensis]
MKKKILCAMAVAGMMSSIFVSTNAISVKAEEYPEMKVFEDVPQGHWAFDAIYDLSYHKIIEGYGNKKFGMGDPVTREQVAVVIYRTLKIEKQGALNNPYRDLNANSTMFLEEILALTKRGIFKGDEHGNFRPKAPLTRAEMAQVLTKAFEFEIKQKHAFRDIPENFWAKDAISALQSNNVVVGTGSGKFEPRTIVTREQYAQFLYNAIINYHLKEELKGK